MEDEVMRLESRVARIEGGLTHFNPRLASAEGNLRDLRLSMDRELGKLDARIDKLEARLEKLIARMETAVEKLDLKISRSPN